jgi:Ca-activated chloride channel family protein
MPGDIDRERYPQAEANPIHSVQAEPVSTFSIDVDTAAYANVRRYLNGGAAPPKDAVRIEELINYFDYDYPLPRTRERPFAPVVSVIPSPWATDKTLLHIAVQGYDAPRDRRPPLNLVLLLDVSGSMNDPAKLPLVKKSIEILLESLTEQDRISMVVYAGAAGVVLEPTSGAETGKIRGALDRLSAGGSTAGGEGLERAYALAEANYRKDAVNRVILATDGDFNVGIADPERLKDFVERKRETGVYLSVLGFGGGNYNDALMQTLSQAGNGVAAYIDTLNEARKVLSDQMQSAMLPIADDVKIQVEFNPGQVAEYRLIGYETRMLNREDFNNDRVDAGDIGAGASVTAIYELTPVGGRTLIDPLRYATPAPATPKGEEIAFLKIRYKPPGAADSILIERAITLNDAYRDISAAPESTRFATAVAGYGQLLRGDPFIDPRRFGWDDVIALANAARGEDPFGYRAEFVSLARNARIASAAHTPTSSQDAPAP